jgi:hypothetical protein
MLTSSRYLTLRPTRCAFCNKPFALSGGYVEAWRTSDGHHFCSEFCADDAEEARFQNQHRAPARSIADNSLRRASLLGQQRPQG